MKKLRVLSLFAGIGGFELGLERTGGFETVAQCEIDPFCRRVLEKHWPHVKRYEDARTLTADTLFRDGIAVDVICGGFPCQDISSAGLGAGIGGKRSGLWSEYARLIGELRPLYIIVENVAALLSRGLDKVLGDMATLGYDAEWHCIPASSIGAPHIRDRVWIVAYPAPQRPAETGQNSQRSAQRACGSAAILAYAPRGKAGGAESRNGACENGIQRPILIPSLRGCDGLFGRADWHSEPSICRVADGISANVDRVGALGNAVVPQIPELIGHAILASLREPVAA